MSLIKDAIDTVLNSLVKSEPTVEQVQQLYYEEARQGDLESMFCYAMLCFGYNGFKKNIGHIEYYLSLAANKGHNDAQYFLGLSYYEGEFLDQDINKGTFWLTISSVNGNADAEDYIDRIEPLTVNLFPRPSSSNLT